MTGADLTWPGIDRERTVAACYHLRLAVLRGRLAARVPVGGVPWSMTRAAALRASQEHLRLARGYLGAVGFEHGARL